MDFAKVPAGSTGAAEDPGGLTGAPIAPLLDPG
jgi:hypothetical protein